MQCKAPFPFHVGHWQGDVTVFVVHTCFLKSRLPRGRFAWVNRESMIALGYSISRLRGPRGVGRGLQEACFPLDLWRVGPPRDNVLWPHVIFVVARSGSCTASLGICLVWPQLGDLFKECVRIKANVVFMYLVFVVFAGCSELDNHAD